MHSKVNFLAWVEIKILNYITMVKQILLSALLGSVSLVSMAQDVQDLVSTKATSLAREYFRPSITYLYITDGSSAASQLVDSMKVYKEDKFDLNAISNVDYVISNVPAETKARDAYVKEYVENLVKDKKIANQILHVWFPTDATGNLSYDVLTQRGSYAATNLEVMQSNNQKRTSLMSELGEKLVDRSYIIAYLITDASKKSKKGEVEAAANVNPYVYKVDFGKETLTTFYADENYTPAGIDKMDIRTDFVMNGKSGETFTSGEKYDDDSQEKIWYICRKVSDFQVKAPVEKVHPVQAAIGRKEGVKPDSRWAVMGSYINPKTGEEKAKRYATVRATSHIIDNRSVATGEEMDDYTKFYVVKGRKVKEGYTLVEDKDLGLGVMLSYTTSEASFGIEYRLGRWIKCPGLSVYVKAGVPWSTKFGGIKIAAPNKDGEIKNFQVFNASVGIAKEFNFANTFSFTPSIEGGMAIAPGAKEITGIEYNELTDTYYYTYNPKKDANLKVYKVGANVKLGYYATRSFQIYLEAGYNYYIKSDEFKNWYQALWREGRIAEGKGDKLQKFQPVSIGFGVKYSF